MYFKVLFFLHFCIAAQDVQLFDQAHALFVQKDFDKALDAYQHISQRTGPVHYNMAQTAFAKQDYAHALVYALRAAKYGNLNVYISAQNLLQQLKQQGYGSDINFLKYNALKVLKIVPMYVWQLLVLLLWFLLVWLLFFRGLHISLSLIALSIVLLFAAVPVMIGYYTETNQAVVVADSVEIFNGPNSALYTIGDLQKGSLITVLEKKKQWIKISHAETVGWIKQSSVEKI